MDDSNSQPSHQLPAASPLNFRSAQPSSTPQQRLPATHIPAGPTLPRQQQQQQQQQQHLHQPSMRSYHDTSSHMPPQPHPVHHQLPPDGQFVSHASPAYPDAFASLQTYHAHPHEHSLPSQAPPPHHVLQRPPVPLRPMPPDGNPDPSTGRPMYPGDLEMPGHPQSRDSGDESNAGSLTSSGVGRPSTGSRAGTNVGITPGATSQITPVKDENGKFPCPHCSKDYLHAKHLKRHLLRHTGDRPYSCVLCSDTFSRSDILKRHFAKCAARRGNPHGLTHLSNAHANQRKAKEESEKAGSPTSGSGGTSPGDGKKGAGKACDQCVKLKVKCDLGNPCERCRAKSCECIYSRNQKRSSPSDEYPPHSSYSTQGFMDPSTGGGYTDGFNFPPPVHPHAHLTQQGNQALTGQHIKQPRLMGMSAPMHNPMKAVSSPPGQYVNSTQMSSVPATGAEEWTGFIGQSPGGSYPDSYYAASDVNLQPSPLDPDLHDQAGIYSVLYQSGNWSSKFPENAWKLPPDPLQEKCGRLLDFCVSGTVSGGKTQLSSEAIMELKAWLAPDNVNHFMKLYFANFQNHFPMVHTPTFNMIHTSDSLLMSLICVGMVYSDRIEHDDVRRLMDYVYNAMIRRIHPNNDPEYVPPLEDLQAIQLVYILFTWHGNFQQRKLVRDQYHALVDLALRAGMYTPRTLRDARPEDVSYLHQIHSNIPSRKPPFNWNAWIEQEKRNKVMFTVFMLDSAFVIYFNVSPHVRTADIRITLPCDDKAWEAATAEECEAALGYNRDDSNDTYCGGRQMDFGLALRILMTPGMSLPFCGTNAYGKFVLVHALHVQVWHYQKHNEDPSSMSMQEWIQPLTKSMPNPCLEPRGAEIMEANLMDALETWKKAWDEDFPAQFPDPASRVGFCRDGMPYYWLARRFLGHTVRSQLGFHPRASDHNVSLTVQMLRQAKAYIAAAERGQPPPKDGDVTKIDSSYGAEDLAYDMKLLFRPTNKEEDYYGHESLSHH